MPTSKNFICNDTSLKTLIPYADRAFKYVYLNIYIILLLFAVNSVAQYLCFLFNACIVHGCVPEAFLTSHIVPVIKEKMCNRSTFDN